MRFSRHGSGVQWAKRTEPPDHQRGRGPLRSAPLAHRRPGYPSVGLLASRARLRFARQEKRSAVNGTEARRGRKEADEEVDGRGEGAMAASRRDRQEGTRVAPDGPGLPVLLVKVRVP